VHARGPRRRRRAHFVRRYLRSDAGTTDSADTTAVPTLPPTSTTAPDTVTDVSRGTRIVCIGAGRQRYDCCRHTEAGTENFALHVPQHNGGHAIWRETARDGHRRRHVVDPAVYRTIHYYPGIQTDRRRGVLDWRGRFIGRKTAVVQDQKTVAADRAR